MQANAMMLNVLRCNGTPAKIHIHLINSFLKNQYTRKARRKVNSGLPRHPSSARLIVAASVPISAAIRPYSAAFFPLS